MGSYLFYPAYFEIVEIMIIGAVILSVFLPFLLAIIEYSCYERRQGDYYPGR
jgi:hypothetical protein